MRNAFTVADEERATLLVAFVSHGIANADLDFPATSTPRGCRVRRNR
jgi:hypothetical protein